MVGRWRLGATKRGITFARYPTGDRRTVIWSASGARRAPPATAVEAMRPDCGGRM